MPADAAGEVARERAMLRRLPAADAAEQQDVVLVERHPSCNPTPQRPGSKGMKRGLRPSGGLSNRAARRPGHATPAAVIPRTRFCLLSTSLQAMRSIRAVTPWIAGIITEGWRSPME